MTIHRVKNESKNNLPNDFYIFFCQMDRSEHLPSFSKTEMTGSVLNDVFENVK